ncbi:sulfite exporter TauE/SafE family protein [Bacillaceae bacterium]
MLIFFTMMFMGGILGFVGAGGSGFIVAILITLFDIPIRTALATGMATMFFTMISGSISHFRAGNLNVKIGMIVGGCGAVGAFAGTRLAQFIPEKELLWMSAGMLIFSSFLIWYRTRKQEELGRKKEMTPIRRIRIAVFVGLTTGTISGTFGIGSTPFVQLGLISLMGNSMAKVAGTTMFVILPIAFLAAIGYHDLGHLDYSLLFQVVVGTMIGSYIGAKFTRKVPKFVLRTSMILIPLLSGMLMLL